ncbi:MAG: lysozyme [Psychrobacillus psychrodurans]
MKVSKTCLALIGKWEGLRMNAYLCPAGIPTIGYGTTKWPNGKTVKLGEKITREEANKLLEKQVNEHASTIAQYVKVTLNQNQFDALASFQYNLGRHILKGSYLLNYLNTKQWDKAANSMMQYCKARNPKTGKLEVLRGLQNRRKEEVALFLKEMEVDELVFANKDLEKIYKTRQESKATKELLLAAAAKYLNIKKSEVKEGDLNAIALEVAVYLTKYHK